MQRKGLVEIGQGCMPIIFYRLRRAQEEPCLVHLNLCFVRLPTQLNRVGCLEIVGRAP